MAERVTNMIYITSREHFLHLCTYFSRGLQDVDRSLLNKKLVCSSLKYLAYTVIKGVNEGVSINLDLDESKEK
jgi:hypothetical protein